MTEIGYILIGLGVLMVIAIILCFASNAYEEAGYLSMTLLSVYLIAATMNPGITRISDRFISFNNEYELKRIEGNRWQLLKVGSDKKYPMIQQDSDNDWKYQFKYDSKEDTPDPLKQLKVTLYVSSVGNTWGCDGCIFSLAIPGIGTSLNPIWRMERN
jgi:hypothetical protein